LENGLADIAGRAGHEDEFLRGHRRQIEPTGRDRRANFI